MKTKIEKYIIDNAFSVAIIVTGIFIAIIIAIINPNSTNYNDEEIIAAMANAPTFIEPAADGGFNYHIVGGDYGWVADSPSAIEYVCNNTPGWEGELDPIAVWAIKKYIAT